MQSTVRFSLLPQTSNLRPPTIFPCTVYRAPCAGSYLYFPIMEMLHTFMAGKPPRLWVNPYLGFSS